MTPIKIETKSSRSYVSYSANHFQKKQRYHMVQKFNAINTYIVSQMGTSHYYRMYTSSPIIPNQTWEKYGMSYGNMDIY